MAGRTDLIAGLENMIALTYGVWPRPGDEKVMFAYTNPEGEPVRMVAEIGVIYPEIYLSVPYHPSYNPFRLPRHVASPLAVDFLVEQAEKFPTAAFCDLGDVPDELCSDVSALIKFIAEAAARQGCPDGVYVSSGLLLRVADSQAELISLSD